MLKYRFAGGRGCRWTYVWRLRAQHAGTLLDLALLTPVRQGQDTSSDGLHLHDRRWDGHVTMIGWASGGGHASATSARRGPVQQQSGPLPWRCDIRRTRRTFEQAVQQYSASRRACAEAPARTAARVALGHLGDQVDCAGGLWPTVHSTTKMRGPVEGRSLLPALICALEPG